MSNFITKIKHPKTGEIVDATFIDNYFRQRKYGVQVIGEDNVYKEDEVERV